jgi:hypothetical protein
LTKIRIIGFENLTPRIKSKIGLAISKSGFAKVFQSEVVSEIRKNGVEPQLKPSTIKTRRYLQNFNATQSDFRPDKSNLTLTGQLLDSIRARFIAAKLTINLISSDTKHKRYKTGTNKGKSSMPSLVDIFKFQKDAGRDIAQIFTRRDFLELITRKLKTSIRNFYKN